MKPNYPPTSPYRNPLSQLKNRVLWDLKRQSRVSRKHLKSVLGKYDGQKAVIVCNGPSLLKTEFSLLKNVYTFGLNKINMLFDKTDWRPSSIVSVNPHVIEQNAEFFNQSELPLYLAKAAIKRVLPRPNVCFLDTGGGSGMFARNCCGIMAEGHTVTYVAMQIAFHMGFTKVALIGCDHNFATKGPANKVVKAEKSDPDHFDPNYFAGGVTWQLPDLVKSELHYQIAAENFSEDNRLLVNSTDGGKLDLLPRLSLTKFLEL